jgi:hypothetical protein
MPKGVDWMNFIYVNLGFIAQVVAMYYFTAVKEIKENWPKYRCNPVYMPLSDNLEQDFTYCIQNIQTSYMGTLLEPITYITSNLGNLGAEFSGNINGVRLMISNIRSFASNILQSLFGVFLNLIIEFQKIIIGIKDLMGKLIGIMVTMMYILNGSLMTMNSAWKGPPGQMVKGLSGKCFHPTTLLEIEDGNRKYMKNISLGDILVNGSRVVATMKIENTEKEKYYKFPGGGVHGDDILVTGTHMVFDDSKGKFVEVKEHPHAVLENKMDRELYCLITDNHRIKIGKYLFWDWEDDVLKL